MPTRAACIPCTRANAHGSSDLRFKEKLCKMCGKSFVGPGAACEGECSQRWKACKARLSAAGGGKSTATNRSIIGERTPLSPIKRQRKAQMGKDTPEAPSGPNLGAMDEEMRFPDVL